MSVHVCVCVSVCVHACVYERERERENSNSKTLIVKDSSDRSSPLLCQQAVFQVCLLCQQPVLSILQTEREREIVCVCIS